MKKLLLILFLVLALCACGKTEVSPEVLPESESSSSEEGKTLIMIKWGHGQEFKK